MVESRAASASSSSQPNSLMKAAPIQNASGPSSGMGSPTICGNSQSSRPPRVLVFLLLLPAASSVFHGSRRSRPGQDIEQAQRNQSPARERMRGRSGKADWLHGRRECSLLFLVRRFVLFFLWLVFLVFGSGVLFFCCLL